MSASAGGRHAVDVATGQFGALITAWAFGDTAAASAVRETADRLGVRRIVLVEGVSDRAALTALAERQGRTLESEGVAVIAMGGATSIGRFVRVLGAGGLDRQLTGLCDHQEEPVFRALLDSYFVCVRDLEEELIRALTPEGAVRVIEGLGDLPLLRTFQSQPYQRSRTIEQQLHRFVGTTAGRKEQYARAFVEGLAPDAVPQPLRSAIAR